LTIAWRTCVWVAIPVVWVGAPQHICSVHRAIIGVGVVSHSWRNNYHGSTPTVVIDCIQGITIVWSQNPIFRQVIVRALTITIIVWIQIDIGQRREILSIIVIVIDTIWYYRRCVSWSIIRTQLRRVDVLFHGRNMCCCNL
jgi:hypothetical protein